MTYSIAITTVDRPYRDAFFQRLVETHTLTHPLVRGVHISANRLPNDNAVHVCRAAIRDAADWVLFLEDDIDIIDDFIGSVDRWLTDVQEPLLQFYPLGSALKRDMRHAIATQARTVRWPIRHFYGITAVAFRTDALATFCDVVSSNPPWMIPVYALDENLKRWHRRTYPTQTDTLTPAPCFVNHLGAQSSQRMAPEHFTGDYPGFISRATRYDTST